MCELKERILHTSLPLEECKAIFQTSIKYNRHKFLLHLHARYIGGFSDDDFWIATHYGNLFSNGSYKKLYGTIVDQGNKRIIHCTFGVSLEHIVSMALFGLVVFVIALPLPRLDIEFFLVGLLYLVLPFWGVILIGNIIIYFLTFYQYNAMFNYIKDLFQCEIVE